jgi:site-specific recombinase XerD
LILDFLDHLETERGNSVRTRNARWAAIHSFMRYAAVRDPASLPITQRVLAIPAKRFNRPVLGYLSRDQIAAILGTPDERTWNGRRDAVLLATAYNTGARVSELTMLRVLTRSGIGDRRDRAVTVATQACPSLAASTSPAHTETLHSDAPAAVGHRPVL